MTDANRESPDSAQHSTPNNEMQAKTKKLLDILTIFSFILSVLSFLLSALSFFGISGEPWVSQPITLLRLLGSVCFFIFAAACARKSRTYIRGSSKSNRRRIILPSVFFLIGLILLAMSLLTQQAPTGSQSSVNGLTFMENLKPNPRSYRIQRDGLTATVRGAELEAKSCPHDSTSFTIPAVTQGTRVEFTLQGYPADGFFGSYLITVQGAGISESSRMSHGGPQRVNIVASEPGDVIITISSQHRPEIGTSCPDSREILSFEDTLLD